MTGREAEPTAPGRICKKGERQWGGIIRKHFPSEDYVGGGGRRHVPGKKNRSHLQEESWGSTPSHQQPRLSLRRLSGKKRKEKKRKQKGKTKHKKSFPSLLNFKKGVFPTQGFLSTEGETFEHNDG